jgi:outer membrane protein insertion porin family
MPNSQNFRTRIRQLASELPCFVAVAFVLTAICNPWQPLIAQDEVPMARESGVIISDVRIEGNQTIPESVIMQKLQSQPQREVTERLIREDKRSLMSTRWFFSVSERLDESPSGLVLVFVVHERPIVQRVEFIGNKKIKDKHLEAWTGLKKGSPFDHMANREAKNRIEQEYKDKGYYFVKVELVKGGQPGERDVVFRINEGPKVQVTARTFEGNRFWSDGDLRKNLITKQKILFFGGIYNPDTIPADIESVKQFYKNVGFFDVQVTAKPLFSKDRSDVNLYFSVTEGKQYTVREIRYQGNSIIATSRLQSDSKLQPGNKFNGYLLSKDVQRMLGYYGELGHYFASVNPVPQFTEKDGIVDLIVEIDEDRPRFIRDINVAYGGDNPHTKQTVVLDRIQLQPGDLAIPKLIGRGRSRLNGSGLFEPGLAFNVSPIEPEQNSFATVSRTWRGQNPSHSPDDWTQKFTYETLKAASESKVDELEWQPVFEISKEQSAEFDENSDDDDDVLSVESPRDQNVSPDSGSESSSGEDSTTDFRPAVHRTVSPAKASFAVATAKPASESDHVDAGPTHRSSADVSAKVGFAGSSATAVETSVTTPSTGHSFGRHQLAMSESSTLDHVPPASRGNAELAAGHSPFAGFQFTSPEHFFSDEGQPFTVPSEAAVAADEPIFRAQSPNGIPGDPALPGYRDPILEGSPFRNQYQEVPPGWVDIDVNATEGRTGRLMFGAGVNSNAGVVGSFVWDESNFDLFRPPTTFADIIEGRAWRGGGQRFRAEAAPGDQVSRYSLSWTDPYFLYTDYGLSVSGFYFNRFYPDWTEDRYGGRVSLSRQFTPEWSGALALRLEEVRLKNPRTPTPASVLPLVGTSFLSTGRVSVTHDTRDSSMMPTEGHYFDVGYEQAFNEFTFPKLETEFRQYYTVYNRADGSGRHVLTLAGMLGWSGDDTPVFERFYAGGFQSFRGFAFRGVTPRENNFSVGGTFQTLGTIEYRVPVTADDMINVVAFTDFGTVDEEVTFDNFRASVGFGLRVVIPAMGPVPLAFDFAFPVAKQDYDDDQIFSFYVGINR